MDTLELRRKPIPSGRRGKAPLRAVVLPAEEKSLQELRQAYKLTQKRLAETLGIRQDCVCRLERRNDWLISTLRGYVEALGGRLSLVAEFPDRQSVIVSGPTLDPEERVV